MIKSLGYTVSEAADELQCSQPLVYYLIHKGHIRAKPLEKGKTGIRIPIEEVQRYKRVRLQGKGEIE